MASRTIFDRIFLLFFLGIQSNICCGKTTRSYFDKCDYNDKCDASKFLICIDERCQCENQGQGSMIFDAELNGCVTNLNESCYLEEEWTRGTGYHNHGNGVMGEYELTKVKLSRKTPCVPNAVCDEGTRKCVCIVKGSEINGKCSSPPGSSRETPFMAMCNYKERRCAENSGLKCVEGKCKCGVDYFQYFNGSKCLSRASGPCGEKMLCAANSECIKMGVHSRCECLPGFEKNREGLCEPGYGQACNTEDKKCSKERSLKCVDGKCQCLDDMQMWDTIYHSCRGLVGAKCLPRRDEWPPFCVKNAFCSDRNSRLTALGICECSSDFSESVNRTCVRG